MPSHSNKSVGGIISLTSKGYRKNRERKTLLSSHGGGGGAQDNQIMGEQLSRLSRSWSSV